MIVYSWRDGARIKANAQRAGEELSDLEEQLGHVPEPDDIVDNARRDDSALHAAFEWDDAIAAANHRRDTARMIRGALRYRVVEAEEEPSEPVEVWEYVDEPSEGRKWGRTEDLLADPHSEALLLRRAEAEARSFARRYRRLARFAAACKALDAAIAAE